MSLHLGNLSSRIRRDELERVFWRFGRCNVQVKDKFGFVIYEYPANAEKALRTLRGKKICGERITVSWSNRQPRPLQSHSRGGRTFAPPRVRNYTREDYANRKTVSDVREDHRRGFRQVDSDGGRFPSADLIDEAKGHHPNYSEVYAGDKKQDFVHDLTDEGRVVEPHLLENDRWGERVVANELENELDFDRYEPYQGDDGKEQDDIHTSSHLDGPPPIRNWREKPIANHVDHPTLEHLNNSKSQKPCYVCGEVGHRMSKCPQELKRLATSSRGHVHLDREATSIEHHKSDREAASIEHHKSDREAASIGCFNHRRLVGLGGTQVARLSNRVRKKDYQEKKRSRRDNVTPQRHHSKKARVLVSSSIHSDYTASRSCSGTRLRRSLSASRTHSRSKSITSRNNSVSSKSRSSSTSSRPRSKNLKSQSMARPSSPTSLSLSVSLGRPMPSSPNKVLKNQKVSLVNSSDCEFKEASAEVEPIVKADVVSANSKLENVKVVLEKESSAALLEAEEDQNNNQYWSKGHLGHHSIARKLSIPQSDSNGHNQGIASPKRLQETIESKREDFIRENKLIPIKNSERSHAANLMRISSQEICTVLKNYGLEQPDDDKKDLPPEIYFGSARLWPWHIIYYRRLKKGPISKDNYARRIVQNEEFGIYDKYIRSSSGWAELTEENP